MDETVRIPAARVVVVMPNWLGDAVMATPFLRALRGVYPGAHIAALARPGVADVLDVAPLTHDMRTALNEVQVWARGGERGTARWIRGRRFELAVVLPNSFRSAWAAFRAGVPRRVGYARGWRGGLLTDRLPAARRTAEQRALDRRRAAAIRALGGPRVGVGSGFQPVPAIDYYLKLAEYLGARNADRRMELRTTDADERGADAALRRLPGEHQPWGGAKIENLVLLAPGANFGAGKCWPPERFAALAQALADPGGAFGAPVILAGAPGEAPLCAAIAAAMTAHRQRVAILSSLNGGAGVGLGVLKALVRRARLLVCNDAGPRHLAAALGVPAVTLFGPTNPVWAETYSPVERLVRVPVPCGPCQLPHCPIDHRCMTGITVEMALAAVREVWQ